MKHMKTSIIITWITVLLTMAFISNVHSQNDDLTTKRNKAIRDNTDSYIELIPNTDLGKVHFSRIHFDESKIELEHLFYQAFMFRVPFPGGTLWWSMISNPLLHSWYIIPKEGEGSGFKNFVNMIVKKPRVSGVNKGDKVIVQWLDEEYLITGKSYIIWFAFLSKYPVDLVISLNILNDDQLKINSVFKGFEGMEK